MAPSPTSRLATLLGLVAALPLAILGLGYFFSTDYQATVFGKWSMGYFLFLLGWWLLIVPGTFLLVRFTFRTQVLELPSGRVLTLRPSAKLVALLVLGWLAAYGVERQIHRAIGRGVATPMASDQFHPYLQNVPKPYQKHFGTNRWGFRGAEIEKVKPADTYRIFVLGGSTVFCAPLRLEETHAEGLRRRLQERHPEMRIEVQNAGAEWHSSLHSLIKFLAQAKAFDPDLVIVWHGINDLYRSFSPEAFASGPYRDDYGHFDGAISSLVRPRQATWRLVGMRLDRWFSDFRCDRVRVAGPKGHGVKGIRQMFFPRSHPIAIDTWPSLGAFERNMRDLVHAAKSRGMGVMIASQPYLYRENLSAEDREVIWFPLAHQESGTRASLASMAAGMRLFNETSRRIAESEGVPFVDLDAGVPKTTEFLYDDVHYTVEGCNRIADALAEAVKIR